MAQEGWVVGASRTIKCNDSSTFPNFPRLLRSKSWNCPGEPMRIAVIEMGCENDMALCSLQTRHCLFRPIVRPQKNGHLRCSPDSLLCCLLCSQVTGKLFVGSCL